MIAVSLFLCWTLGTMAVLLVVLALYLYFFSYHPKAVEDCAVISDAKGKKLPKGKVLKVMTWNQEFFGGRNHVYFFDLPLNEGKRITVEESELRRNKNHLVKIVKAEDPDILLLQEVDERSSRTRMHDQEEELAEKLKEYPYRTSAYYVKSGFHPHRHILRPWRMKLVIFSKYSINEAKRYQLSIKPALWIVRLFYLKRCVLEARIPFADGGHFSVMNTHLDAYAQGSNTMAKQVKEIKALLTERTDQKIPWVIGGDFNLLPNDQARASLADDQAEYYNPHTELHYLTKSFALLPKKSETRGKQKKRWYTYAPNRKDLFKLDRTTDYFFYSSLLMAKNHKVRSRDTQDISDHVPLIGEFKCKSGR
ncbi:MAG: endonuclease/exonuclease/phosphatase family protein [Candidatus Magasanikbacteria bacterium]|nr:endonuclease/exonuclease/phosphatase family protein [Candidatus Magasanikbacteria bacterium]